MEHNDVSVELSSLGASITKVLLPNYKQPHLKRDDVVLAYKSPKEQYKDKNSVYFGAIVGRVANRIKGGRFQIRQTDNQHSGGPSELLETYQLDINNNLNHLHGGFDGFSNRLWKATVADDTIEFALISPDGDQGYPGAIKVKAIYTLRENETGCGAYLHLSMTAELLQNETKSTPISLAQHSYFNLASHLSQERIMGHQLKMPNCCSFTPVDATSIPTGEVLSVDNTAMDFQAKKLIFDALIQYGQENGLDSVTANRNIRQILDQHETTCMPVCGFDHNYVISREKHIDKLALCIAGVLEHPQTGRSLTVRTSAPGVQLYTSNYLNGMDPSLCKEECSYGRWQGICLETQTYPDCISPENTKGSRDSPEFKKGRCFVLQPGGKDYHHDMVFELSSIPVKVAHDPSK